MNLHFINKDTLELVNGSISPLPNIYATILNTEALWNTFLDELINDLETSQMRIFYTSGSIGNSDNVAWICRIYKLVNKVYVEALGITVDFGAEIELNPLHYVKLRDGSIWANWTLV